MAQLLALIETLAQRKKVAVFMDEVQDLMDIEKGQSYLGEMRGIIQHQAGIPYVFAGSNRE